MTATQPTPRRASSGQSPVLNTQPRTPISEITGKGAGLPNRYLLHAVEGFGKTSFGANTIRPIFIQTKGETGLDTLIDSGVIAETPHFPGACQTWDELRGCIETLLVDPHEFRTLVIDTVNGCERLCHEDVCRREFDGEWGDKGFGGYQRGAEVSLAPWLELLADLDKLRIVRKMTILGLAHTKVENFKNPEGPDFDRYQPDMNKKTWGLTHKWADVVLFGNFETTMTAVKTDKKTGASKGKGMGGQHRILYTERHAAYDAKNRLNLPPEIDMGENAAEAWTSFITAVKAGRLINQEVVTNG